MLLHMADAKQRDGAAERRNRAGMSRRERRTPNSEMELRGGGIELGKSIRKRRTPKKTERTLDFF